MLFVIFMIGKTKGPYERTWFLAQYTFCCQLEKVQKVSAQSPTVAEMADAPETSTNGLV